MVNLVLAGIWVVAAAFLSYQIATNPQVAENELTQIFRWIAVAMVFYNLIRWWSMRTVRRTQQQAIPTPARRLEERENLPTEE